MDSARGITKLDVGVHSRVGPATAISIGFQNILCLAGLFLFPGLLGASFKLPPAEIGYLYGITFMTSGLVVILQSVLLLRLPIVQGPFAGVFAAVLVTGHQRGLGVAFGSLLVACAVWCLLAIPLKRFSAVAVMSRYLRLPVVSGVILLIMSAQLATIALPNWIGKPGMPGFPSVNLLASALAALIVVACMMTRSRTLRRGAMLWGVAIGAAVYTLLAPTTWERVLHAQVFSVPKLFPFGFGIDAFSVVTFFIVLFPAIAETVATYEIVAEWSGEPLSRQRVAQGVFGEVFGSLVGALFGGMATLAYPDNVALLRVTRVGSRYVTLTTGIILLLLGGFGIFDAALVAIPTPVLSGATAILFAMLFASGIEVLSGVQWNRAHLLAAGLPFILAMGAFFTPEAVQNALPSWARLLIGQPLVVGAVLSLLIVGVFRLAGTRQEEPRLEPATT